MSFSIAHRSLAVSACLLAFGSANAAVQRTFVASYGLPANTAFNCSIAHPCRAFSEALSVTASGGEVVVLDSAGYGPVTITQSVSIIAPRGIYAGVSVLSGIGILINGAGINVALRGLSINGQTPAATDGINVFGAGSVEIDGCVLTNMNGEGIQVTSTTEVRIANTVIRHVYGEGVNLGPGVDRASLTNLRIEESPGGHGIYAFNVATLAIVGTVIAKNAGSGVHVGRHDAAITRATISGSTVVNNGSQGIDVFANNSSRVELNVIRNEIVANGANGAYLHAESSAAVVGLFTDNLVSGNASTGVSVDGVGVTATAIRNTIGNSVYGLSQANGAVLKSPGDNISENNATAPTSGSITIVGGY